MKLLVIDIHTGIFFFTRVVVVGRHCHCCCLLLLWPPLPLPLLSASGAHENCAVADTKLILAPVLSDEERNVALRHKLEAIFAHHLDAERQPQQQQQQSINSLYAMTTRRESSLSRDLIKPETTGAQSG